MKELRKHFESLIKASDEAYAGINGKFTEFIIMAREGDDEGTKKFINKISRPFPDGFAWIIPSGPYKGKIVKEFYRDEKSEDCGLVIETMGAAEKSEKTKYIRFTEFPIKELVKLLRCIENLNFGAPAEQQEGGTKKTNLATSMTEEDLDGKKQEEKTPLEQLVEAYTKPVNEPKNEEQQEEQPVQEQAPADKTQEEKTPEENAPAASEQPTYTGRPIEPDPNVFG